MESSDRKNVYLAKTGDNSLNSGMRDTMIVGQSNMAPGIANWKLFFSSSIVTTKSFYRMWWRKRDEAEQCVYSF